MYVTFHCFSYRFYFFFNYLKFVIEFDLNTKPAKGTSGQLIRKYRYQLPSNILDTFSKPLYCKWARTQFITPDRKLFTNGKGLQGGHGYFKGTIACGVPKENHRLQDSQYS
jgi:hypothetical protein